MPPPNTVPFGWILKMAWRDVTRSWLRLLLYMSATGVGIGALAAAGSLQHNLEQALRVQAKPLNGADLVVRSRASFDEEGQKFLNSLPYPKLREVELATVAEFPDKNGSRLMELRAVEPGFPFYGEIRTEPPGALAQIFSGSILIEQNVMAEFGLTTGEAVLIGRKKYTVAGAILLAPGEAMASVFSAPRAYISLDSLSETGLIEDQSLARQLVYFKIDNEEELKRALALTEPIAKEKSWRLRTVADRQEGLGKRAGNAGRFLKLAALAALILGGIGVASVLFTYTKTKRPIAATLVCLGAPARSTFGIFVVQGLFLGLAGTLVGTVIGVGLQIALSAYLRRWILIDVPFAISWGPMLSAAVAGFSLTFLFSLLPLLKLRTVTPLAALRIDDELEGPFWKDRAVWVVGVLIFLLLFVFAKLQIGRTTLALAVPAGLCAAFLVLSYLTQAGLRRLRAQLPDSWPYAWRHGLANLFRPHNQTAVLTATIALGSALILTVSILNDSLLSHISASTSEDQANLALIDIQTPQRDGVRKILQDEGAGIVEEVSFVNMRIQEVKSTKPVDRSDWAFTREYRSTYRNTIGEAEALIAGQWPPKSVPADGPIPVSLEEEIAERLGVEMGGEITFNVHGALIPTVVTALRKVDWFQIRPNFFVIFPAGVLEEAPQFTVLLARAASPAVAGAIQRQTRNAFPNVSTVDLRMVLASLRTYFRQAAFALQIMAMFVVATGFMILASALAAGRFERQREAALLRVLGASGKEIRLIHIAEYGLIGFFSAAAGLVLGLAGSIAASRWGFEMDLEYRFLPIFTVMAGVTALTIGTGLILGRGLLNKPPLETLKAEE